MKHRARLAAMNTGLSAFSKGLDVANSFSRRAVNQWPVAVRSTSAAVHAIRAHRRQSSATTARLLEQQCPLLVRKSSWSLALRAGVLRRAVCSSVRPLLRLRTSSVSVGRMPLRSALVLQAPRPCAFVSWVLKFQVARACTRPSVRPNRSLNRTHCGMRLKARHFILGL